MKPARFDFYDPDELEDVLELLTEHGDEAKILAGGQSLMPMLAMRLSAPRHVVDINAVGELASLRQESAHLVIGALTRHVEAEESLLVRDHAPLIARAMRWVGHRAIRNRGTIGGSVAHADPAAELPAVMTALDATVVARSSEGTRSIPIEAFYDMPLVSELRPDELLVEMRVPINPPGAGSAVVEVARRHGDFALAGVAARTRLGSDGRLVDLRLVSFATGPAPMRLRAAEAALEGATPDPASLAAAGEAARGDIAPTGDMHASADYRRSVTAVLVGRAVAEAAADANDAGGR